MLTTPTTIDKREKTMLISYFESISKNLQLTYRSKMRSVAFVWQLNPYIRTLMRVPEAGICQSMVKSGTVMKESSEDQGVSRDEDDGTEQEENGSGTSLGSNAPKNGSKTGICGSETNWTPSDLYLSNA
ncbi:hypothetical protein PGB90_009284 [Kerria lacca]